MTKKDFDKMFVSEILPLIKVKENEYRKSKDIPLRCAEYNDLTDCYFKNGLITENQAKTWCIPKRLI